MRRFLFLLLIALATGMPLRAADVDVSGKGIKFRPALPATGNSSLINSIDGKGLIAKGQQDGLVKFTCTVRRTGEVFSPGVFGGTASTKLLEDEVLRVLNGAKFSPGIFEYKPVEVLFYGTVVFANINGKPRLRLFCNQEDEELKKESDFISPQVVAGHYSAFTGFHYPSDSIPVVVNGVVRLSIDVDLNGEFHRPTLVSEEPPFIGFAEAATGDLMLTRCIPAFRDGKPVESVTTITIFYRTEG